MYYEEKLINGILMWRNTPHGVWTQCSIEKMSQMIIDLKNQLSSSNPIVEMENRLVCSACLSKCGKHMAIGIRHFDKVMRKNMNGLSYIAEYANLPVINWRGGEQGFIDRKSNFLNREDAYIVAKNANQIIRQYGGDEGKLFSENLY